VAAVALRTPVVLCLFNRPETTRRVLEVIAAVRPRRLFVIADGPRPDRPDEARRCIEARRLIETMLPDCELIRDYAAENLGCGRRIASGLTRVFEQTPEAIVLEDDCLPDPSFFAYCDALLERYRDDARVMMVSGSNDLIAWRAADRDYHYSRYGSVWGWASWRRAWRHYDFAMTTWHDPAGRARLAEVLGDEEQVRHRAGICDRTAAGAVDTWDYQWTWARLRHGGLTVVPARNLVSNLGFGRGATHTVARFALGANAPRYAVAPPLRPPTAVAADAEYDRRWFEWQVGRPSAAAVLERARALRDAGRHAQLLLLGRDPVATARLDADARAELDDLTAQAVAALRAVRSPATRGDRS